MTHSTQETVYKRQSYDTVYKKQSYGTVYTRDSLQATVDKTHSIRHSLQETVDKTQSIRNRSTKHLVVKHCSLDCFTQFSNIPIIPMMCDTTIGILF